MLGNLPLVLVDGLPPAEVLTPSILLGFTVLAIITGRLIPRRTYDDKAHEADEWRAEARIKDQQIHELTEQNTVMLREFGPTVTALLRGIRDQAEVER